MRHVFIMVIMLCSAVIHAQTPTLSYSSSSGGFTEISSSNDGALSGDLTVTIANGQFSNPSGTLTAPNDFSVNIQSSYTITLTISADGTTGTLNISGQPSFHQPANNVSDITFTFTDAAFVNLTANNVTNAVNAATGFSVNYQVNPSLTYQSVSFLEVAANDGSLTGSGTITISDGNFSNAGSTLTLGTDYTINNLPAGLTPTLMVNSDGTIATLALTGNATANETANNVNLNFTFNNSAFNGGIAASTVFNSSSFSSSIKVDFNDNPRLSYSSPASTSSPFNIADISAAGDTLALSINARALKFNGDGTQLYISTSSTGNIDTYTLSEPFNIKTASATSSHNLINRTIWDFTFDNDGGQLILLRRDVNNVSGFLEVFQLSTAFDVSTASEQATIAIAEMFFPGLGRTEFGVGVGGFQLSGLSFAPDGTALFLSMNRGGLVKMSLATAFDVRTAVFDQVFRLDSDNKAFNIRGFVLFNAGSGVYVHDALGNILQYKMSTPYDLSTISFNIADSAKLENVFKLLLVNDKLHALENSKLITYEFLADDFLETSANDGAVTGSLNIGLENGSFENANGILNSNHFTIDNLPTGLSAEIAVSANAKAGTLTISGNATSNARPNSISDLLITFNNDAFQGVVDVKDFHFALSASTGSELRFNLDDTAAPTYTISASVTSGPSATTFPMQIVFSEAVTGFTSDDLLFEVLGNSGSVTFEVQNFTGSTTGTSYSFDMVTSGNDVEYQVRPLAFNAFDASGNGNVIGESVRIVAGNPPIRVNGEQFSVAAFSKKGTVIDTVEIFNKSEVNPITKIEITDKNGQPLEETVFSVDSLGVLRVVAPDSLSRSIAISRELRIVATTSDFRMPFGDFTISIVEDGNEPPTIEAQSFTIPEHPDSAQVVGTIAATDPEGAPLNYELINNQGAYNIDSIFTVNEAGEILVLDSADIRMDLFGSFEFVVRVDDGVKSRSVVATVQVTEYVNRTPIITDQILSVMENIRQGETIGTILASDPEDSVLSYSIVSTTDEYNILDILEIGETNGLLSVLDPSELEFDLRDSIFFDVSVSDGEAAASAKITVGIIEVILSASINDYSDEIYPNPVNQFLNLKTEGNYRPETYVILDVSGKRIKEANMPIGNQPIDLSSLEKGVYILAISAKEGQRLYRFIKQ